MKRKSLRDFIRENRAEIDRIIRFVSNSTRSLNDDERRMWILNDEGLYKWARSKGVQI